MNYSKQMELNWILSNTVILYHIIYFKIVTPCFDSLAILTIKTPHPVSGVHRDSRVSIITGQYNTKGYDTITNVL